MRRLSETDLFDIELKRGANTCVEIEWLIDTIRDLWWEREHEWMIVPEDEDDFEEAQGEGREDRKCDEASGLCAEYDIGTCRPALPFV